MSMPFSVALQLSLVLACVPAVILAILAGQITQPASVNSESAVLSTAYKPTFSDASASQAEKRTMSGTKTAQLQISFPSMG